MCIVSCFQTCLMFAPSGSCMVLCCFFLVLNWAMSCFSLVLGASNLCCLRVFDCFGKPCRYYSTSAAYNSKCLRIYPISDNNIALASKWVASCCLFIRHLRTLFVCEFDGGVVMGADTRTSTGQALSLHQHVYEKGQSVPAMGTEQFIFLDTVVLFHVWMVFKWDLRK